MKRNGVLLQRGGQRAITYKDEAKINDKFVLWLLLEDGKPLMDGKGQKRILSDCKEWQIVGFSD